MKNRFFAAHGLSDNHQRVQAYFRICNFSFHHLVLHQLHIGLHRIVSAHIICLDQGIGLEGIYKRGATSWIVVIFVRDFEVGIKF